MLAEDITAPVDLPPFPASAMDGYALRLEDWRENSADPFTLIGESLAGHPFAGTVGRQECVRVFTGGVVPTGADQVIVQEERLHVDGNRVTFRPHTASESFVRPIGHDIHRGQILARAGSLITPLLLGSLAAAGIATVKVFQRLKVGVFSTGDELVDTSVAPEDLQAGQIYDSNRATMLALLSDLALETIDLGRLPDNAAKTREALSQAAGDFDALISSGGVSVGDADFVTNTIRELGELTFWKLNLKPGKPMAIGKIKECWLFGLPGNPVSTIVTLLLIARPALLKMAGLSEIPTPIRVNAELAVDLAHRPGRTEFQRGVLYTENGTLYVTHTGDQSSNRLSSFAAANCLIEIGADLEDPKAGTLLPTLSLQALLSTSIL